MDKMKAFKFYAAHEPLRLEEVPIPKLKEDEVLVKVRASGVCGSDLNYRRGKARPYKVPIILGHEISGTVEEMGEKVEGLEVGERVLVHYIISCGRCAQCMRGNDNRCRRRISIGAHVDGGFAEYVAIPARNAFKLPSNLTFEEGAIIGCAVSTPFHALLSGGFKAGDSVAVFGLGGIGIHAVMWARTLGAGLIIGVDVVDFKLELAKELGADVTVNPKVDDPVEVIRDLTDGWGVDLALECAGVPETVNYTLNSIRGKSRYETGKAILIALQPGPVKVEWIREGLVTMPGDHTMDDLRRILTLAERGRIDLTKTITHRLPFLELNRALDILEGQTENVVKVVVTQQR